jgi:tetratricopeptide (TPR) repeat protein
LFEKTIEVCKKAIKIKPDSRAYYTIGLSCARLGESEKAIKAYKKAIEIEPDKNEAYNNMGFAYAGLDKFEEAIEAYEKAHIVISLIIIRINLNGFFISLNCLLKLI